MLQVVQVDTSICDMNEWTLCKFYMIEVASVILYVGDCSANDRNNGRVEMCYVWDFTRRPGIEQTCENKSNFLQRRLF